MAQRGKAAPEVPAEAAEGSCLGPVEQATLAELDRLTQAHGWLGQTALALARAVDTGSTMAMSANAKELKSTMRELTPDDGGNDFTRLMAQLTAPAVRDAEAS